MNTLSKYLLERYPTSEEKQKVKEITIANLTQNLEGGELDLSAFTSLEKLEIDQNFLTTPLTKINTNGLTNLKELILLEKKIESEADKKLYEELGISEEWEKKKVVQEIQKLAESKGIKINFKEKTEDSIFISLDQKDKQKLEWTKDNLNEDYQKDFEALLNPSTFPTERLEIKELLSIYYSNSENIADSQENKVSTEILELVSQELSKNSKFKAKINELITTTPLKLEVEYLKGKQDQLPTAENFDKLTRQKELNQNLAGSLDLSYFTKLEELNCTNNSLTGLVLFDCPNLKRLQADKGVSIYALKGTKDLLMNNLKKEQNQKKKQVKFTGDLTIQDYPQLKVISFSNHELTSLTIINCPNLKEVNARRNQLTKLEIRGDNQITELFVGQNQLESLNLTNCSKLKKLIIPDNPLLSKLEGLNLSEIKEMNINNTLVNLAEDYEKLKTEKQKAVEDLKILKEAAEEKGFSLTQAIQNSIQADEALQSLCKKTEKDYRGKIPRSDFIEKIKELALEIENKTQLLTKQETNNKELETELSETQTNLKTSQTELTNRDQIIKERNGEINNLKTNLDSFNEKNNSLLENISKLEEKNEEQYKTIEDLQNQAKIKEEELQTLQSRPNITEQNYQELLNNQEKHSEKDLKPTNLPDD
nr:11298_t:CDS:2 [Entrophospora candida]